MYSHTYVNEHVHVHITYLYMDIYIYICAFMRTRNCVAICFFVHLYTTSVYMQPLDHPLLLKSLETSSDLRNAHCRSSWAAAGLASLAALRRFLRAHSYCTVDSCKPLEPKEGEPRQPNKAYWGQLGEDRASRP